MLKNDFDERTCSKEDRITVNINDSRDFQSEIDKDFFTRRNNTLNNSVIEKPIILKKEHIKTSRKPIAINFKALQKKFNQLTGDSNLNNSTVEPHSFNSSFRINKLAT